MKNTIKRSGRFCLSCFYNSYIFRAFRRLFSLKLTMFLQHLVLQARWADAFEEEAKELIARLMALEGGKTPISKKFLLTQFWESSIFNYFGPRKLLANSERRIPVNKVVPTELKPSANILFVTSVFPSLNHGGGLRAFDLMHELSSLGYRIHLYSVEPNGDEQETTKGLDALLTSSKIVSSSKFNIKEFEAWLNSSQIDFDFGYFIWPQSVDLMEESTGRIRAKAFEFIEVTTRRVWMDIQAYFQKNSLDKLHQKVGEFLTNHYLEKKAALIADKLICLTEKDAEFVEKIFLVDKPIMIVKTGISRHVMLEKILQSKSTVTPNTVGFIGNFDHYPNIEGIVWFLDHCHARVLEACPEYQFVIMGKGPISPIKNKYSHFGPSINWLGPIADVVVELQKMEVCVAPLINGAGLRGKVNQYAVLAKPFVSTSIGCCGTPYVNGDSAFIEDDPIEFSNRIIHLLKNKDFARKIGGQAYNVVKENFLWEKPIKSLISLLNQ